MMYFQVFIKLNIIQTHGQKAYLTHSMPEECTCISKVSYIKQIHIYYNHCISDPHQMGKHSPVVQSARNGHTIGNCWSYAKQNSHQRKEKDRQSRKGFRSRKTEWQAMKLEGVSKRGVRLTAEENEYGMSRLKNDSGINSSNTDHLLRRICYQKLDCFLVQSHP